MRSLKSVSAVLRPDFLVLGLFREESRGAHFRADFPRPDDRRFRGHTLLEAESPRLADVELPLQVGV